LSQELVTYIVLGSVNRLKNLKLPKSDIDSEYLRANLKEDEPFEKTLDKVITTSKGRIIVLLPPSSFPTANAKKLLRKISMIDLSAWGWFDIKEKNNLLNNLKKISTIVRSIPHLEQGIYFNKRLYFSVGGIGKFNNNYFNEIAKRLYSRIDPQNPLPALIIRTKNLDLF